MKIEKIIELGSRIEEENPFTQPTSRGLWISGVLLALKEIPLDEDDIEDYAIIEGYRWAITKIH